MADMTNKIIIGVFSVILIYFFITVAYDTASPNASEVLTFNNATANNTTNSPIVVINSVSNATYTFDSDHYTNDDYGVTITMNDSEANSTYTVDYDYEASATVWDLDLSFMAILVTVGVVFLLVMKLTEVK